MKIEIELTPKEITGIVIEHLQSMFPGKDVMGEIYNSAFFVVIDKKPEETAEEK